MSINVKSTTDEFIMKLAIRYLSAPYITFYSLAYEYGCSSGTISNILFRGISENILSDNISDQIFDKVVYSSEQGVHQRILRWEKAFDLRNERKKDLEVCQKQHILDKIAYVADALQNFDDYHTDEDGAPSKEDLESELSSLNRSLVGLSLSPD